MSESDVARRAQVVRTNLDKLARIPQSSYDEFAGDFRSVDASLHLLPVSIQALIDLGSSTCARLGLETPRSSHEILERL